MPFLFLSSVSIYFANQKFIPEVIQFLSWERVSDSKKAGLTKDVRYQEFREVTLGLFHGEGQGLLPFYGITVRARKGRFFTARRDPRNLFSPGWFNLRKTCPYSASEVLNL